MSTEPESFLARWSRRKRAAEREVVRPEDSTAPELAAPATQAGGVAAAGDPPVVAPASVCESAATPEVPLPPIESLDGLRSDYQAFFQQPVDDELRHAALKKLFADPHFNQMDMLDVYVDDYTQFEPLPAALRLRLPSARSFLLESERDALEADEARNGAAPDASESMTAVRGPGDGVAADASGQEGSPAADLLNGVPSGLPAEGTLMASGAAAPYDAASPTNGASGQNVALDKSNTSGRSSS